MRHIAISLFWFAGSLAAATHQVDFNREIRPILSDNCFACHGPDEKQRVANLRLDQRESIFAARNGYRIVVPGDSASSRLIERITTSNKSIHMPPVSSGYALNVDQIGLLRDWVAQGAKWESHWAFVPPARPAVPKGKGTNPIDAFVRARLDKEGLKPSPEADRVTLLRRLSFDLTGLPPSLAEIDAYLADKSPRAYEKQVDRLLASPRHAERMAMQWLDLARYADTHGYHIDSHRDMWPWRDWLIRAFAANLPFDRFVTEQLAGDLLPKPTRDQLVATGFNRNHMINFEGGAIAEEYQVEYVMDRVDTTSQVFLGMTMGCARCHDHKYDPISQRDFYRFYAFFNRVPERGLDGQKGNADPKLLLPNQEQELKLEATRASVKQLREQLEDAKITPLIAQWAPGAVVPEASRAGLAAHFEFDGNLNDSSGGYRYGRVETGRATFGAGPVAQELQLDGQSRIALGPTGDFDVGVPFAISLWLRPNTSHSPNLKDEMLVARRTDSARHGWELYLADTTLSPRLRLEARVGLRLNEKFPESGLEVRSKNRYVRIDDLNHLALSYDGKQFEMWINGERVECEIIADSLRGSAKSAAILEVGELGSAALFRGGLDDLRIYTRALTSGDVTRLLIHEPARAAARIGPSRGREQTRLLREYYLMNDAPAEFRAAFAELRRNERALANLEFEIPNTMVMADQESTRETRILGRGDYQNKGEVVTAATPAVLPPLPAGAHADRLGVAQWLLDRSNPLTARVAVNRYWQMYFGTGLVKTSEDFGAQGESPSHPELLDWLATEFRESGWDIRHMQKLIVLSSTYRQSSKFTLALLEHDPENRLLARGVRVRLPAEMIRDNALATSGLLVEKLGGPSVKTYQPSGLWEDIAFGGPYSAQSYTQDHGEALYRRSLYMLWKRTSPPPSLATFDAPSREKCVARRSVTNTPLQALVLLNDPQYIEAARALAQRILREGGVSIDSKVAYGFRLATGRKPEARENEALKMLLDNQLSSYQRDKAKTAKLLGVGESQPDASIDPATLAAWTMVASTMLSLDETITKE